jgi:hypothetical protein
MPAFQKRSLYRHHPDLPHTVGRIAKRGVTRRNIAHCTVLQSAMPPSLAPRERRLAAPFDVETMD